MNYIRPAVIVFTVLLCFTHLFACVAKRVRLRCITKCLIMPLICAVYLCFAQQVNPFVLLAIGFGWLGDVLLLSSTRKPLFVLGASGFAVGHFFYMAAVMQAFVTGFYRPMLLLALLFLLIPAVITFFLRRELKREKSLRIPMVFYFAVLSALGLFCAAAVYIQPTAATVTLLAGAVLFLVSDTILVSLVMKVDRAAGCGNFWVMLTYILAQSLLAVGFCL